MSSTLDAYLSRPWLKLYDDGVPHDIDVPEAPLYSVLVESARAFPGRASLSFFGRTTSYADLMASAMKFAGGLRDELGVKKGDVVSLILPNMPGFATAYYGSLLAGAIVSPMSPLYTPWEIERALSINGAKVLVALDTLHRNVEQAISRAGAKPILIYTGVDDYLPGHLAFLYRLKERGNRPPNSVYSSTAHRLSDILRSSKGLSEPEAVNPMSDIAALMFTGGTTGLPKAARLSHRNLLANVLQVDAWYKGGQKASEVYMGALPWFHIYGQTVALNVPMYRAATVIVLPTPDIDEILKGIQRYRVNVFHGAPALYAMIVNRPGVEKFDLSSVEACISGAGPLPKAVHEKFEGLTGAKLREGYGLTEASPVTHVNPINGKYKIGSIGLPVPSTYAIIMDQDGDSVLPPGKVGELAVSGPQVMMGYTTEEERAFVAAGGMTWLRTGDIGYMDEEGYFYIVDRKKDMVKYKGYSVYPREVEEVLFKNDCVADAAVVGIPHDEFGEVLKAFVVLKRECRGRVTQDDLLKYCREYLVSYAVPKEIEFRERLPKSGVGKTLRYALRDEELSKRGGAARPAST